MLTYRNKKGDQIAEPHGDEAQAIHYARAYKADGFTVLSLVNLATGNQVDYSGEYEDDIVSRVGYDDRSDET